MSTDLAEISILSKRLDRNKGDATVRTSSFFRAARLNGAVSISNGVPDFFRGPQYKIVAPRWDMLKMSREDYDREFELILERLDPEEVYQSLLKLGGADPILLCWEKPNEWCHRRRVAEWIEQAMGIEITEHGFERDKVLPYNAPPPKPELKQLELF